MGINRDTYAQYETNRRRPDYETLIAFADIYRISVDELLDHPTPIKEPRVGQA